MTRARADDLSETVTAANCESPSSAIRFAAEFRRRLTHRRTAGSDTPYRSHTVPTHTAPAARAGRAVGPSSRIDMKLTDRANTLPRIEPDGSIPVVEILATASPPRWPSCCPGSRSRSRMASDTDPICSLRTRAAGDRLPRCPPENLSASNAVNDDQSASPGRMRRVIAVGLSAPAMVSTSSPRIDSGKPQVPPRS